jgi:hypothetical protein
MFSCGCNESNNKLKKTLDMAQVKENQTLFSQTECLGIKGKHF